MAEQGENCQEPLILSGSVKVVNRNKSLHLFHFIEFNYKDLYALNPIQSERDTKVASTKEKQSFLWLTF